MGASCQRMCAGGSVHGNRLGGPEVQQNQLFSGPYNTGRGLPQILVLGPEGAGKTTLAYATVLPGWQNMVTEVVPTVTFHHEDIIRSELAFGIWDVSGSLTMQMLWPTFYRLIAFDALVFVVSILDTSLADAKTWIRRLVNEESLRRALMLVVINNFGDQSKESASLVDTVVTGLGLEEIPNYIDSEGRFRWLVLNAKDGEQDENWKAAIAWIVTSIRNRNKGQALGAQQPANAVVARSG